MPTTKKNPTTTDAPTKKPRTRRTPEQIVADLEAKIADVKTALEGTDMEAVKDATEALMSARQEFGQRLYEQAAQADREAEAEAGAPADDEVVDAEIIDEDDEQQAS